MCVWKQVTILATRFPAAQFRVARFRAVACAPSRKSYLHNWVNASRSVVLNTDCLIRLVCNKIFLTELELLICLGKLPTYS